MKSARLRMIRVGAAACLAAMGCAHDPVAQTTADRPGGQEGRSDERSQFSRQLGEYRGAVKLLSEMPALDDTDGLRTALLALAGAIAELPDVTRATAQQAAELIRDREFRLWVQARRNPGLASRPAIEALQIASAALQIAARGHDASAPGVDPAVAALQESTSKIDDGKALEENRNAIVEALADALRALDAIESASSTRKASLR